MSNDRYSNPEALAFHVKGKPGKIAISPTKPLISQRDLALAYSPGVAAPCLEIADDPLNAYKYTAKGNFVAVISNGTAVLGLGNLGALASKPVMEGKSVLFKRFADIDSVDIEIDTENVEEFINSVKYLSPSWGGINLEDIKAPDCFVIEDRLKKEMSIPVFHDDQHGTAIVTAAALINACKLTNKKFEDIKLVVLGAGSAGIACLELVKSMGVKNALLVDRNGVIYKGRSESMNEWKEKHAIETEDRTLEDAMRNADAFYGLAGKGAVTKEMIASMAKNPIVFAMANPDPEILPEEVAEIRDDAIMATGRSDYPNQVNNVLGFPYIFRGALDVSASSITESMKVAAANAIAELARQPVPLEVLKAYKRDDMEFGRNYIIPSPFDPRLISEIPVAVAKAAMDEGVARKPIENWEEYKNQLAARLNPTANTLSLIYKKLKDSPKNVIFAEGEEDVAIRAACDWQEGKYGKAILVGDKAVIAEKAEKLGLTEKVAQIEVKHSSSDNIPKEVAEFIYERLQRKGYLKKDCLRELKNDRNVYASTLLLQGAGELMITGLTRSYNSCVKLAMDIVGAKKGERVLGTTIAVDRNNKTVFISDTAMTIRPNAEQLAKIAINTANVAKKFGQEPKVAFLSFSNFGNPEHEGSKVIKDAMKILASLKEKGEIEFEFDGDMTPDTALDNNFANFYSFSNIAGNANCLIMPSLEAANISGKLVKQLGENILIGPILSGFHRSVQIVPMGSSASEILNIAAISSVE